MFQDHFSRYTFPGAETLTCEVDGYTLTAHLEYDRGAGTPWENEDGHGPVSEWTRRDKRPGEWVLCSDGRSRRYYDAQAAQRQAKADGWGPGDVYTWATPAERAAAAVKDDFDALKAWCGDEWFYVGVVVAGSKGEVELDACAASLWGIECNYPRSDNSYLTDVANDLIPEALASAKQARAHMLAVLA